MVPGVMWHLSSAHQSFGIESGLDPRLIFRSVDGGDGLAEGIALSTGYPGCHDRFYAAPLLAALGFDLAHFLTGMVLAAVVAVNGFN